MSGLDLAPRPRHVFLALSLLAITGAILLIERPWEPSGCGVVAATDTPAGARPAPDFCAATAWLGREAQLEEQRGNVVLVDFWTYSCINCIRTLPHLTAWDATYRSYGLVIVGVHSPEFAFEKDADNVRAAMERHGIQYPVVQDNDHAIWENWHNRFWPAKYLVDANGNVRQQHFGEGAYAETEQAIRQLLLEAGATSLPPAVEEGGDEGTQYAGRTPEIYAGYGRGAQSLGNPEGYHPDEVVAYEVPAERAIHKLYLGGSWHNGPEALRADGDPGSNEVVLRFTAGAANFVAEGEGCVRVTLDGGPVPAEVAGPDVDGDCIQLDGARSYDFYAGPFGSHEVRLVFPRQASLYTFAFSNEPMQGSAP